MSAVGVSEDPVDGVALDVHPEDVVERGRRPRRRVGEFHAAGLASSTDLDLGFDDDPVAEALGSRTGVLGVVDDHSQGDGYVVLARVLAWYSIRSTVFAPR